MTLDPRTGAVAIALAAACWGTWRVWLPGPALDASAQGAMVLTVSGVLATVLGLVRDRGLPTAPRAAWGLLVVYAASESANYLLYFRGLGAGDSAAAAVTHYLAPALVALVSPFLGQRVGRRTALAIPVAFAATYVLARDPSASGAFGASAVLGAGSAVFYAANIFLAQRLSSTFSAWSLIGIHNLLAAPLVWAGSSTAPWSAGAAELGLAVAGSVLGGVLAAGAYISGLRVVSASRAAVLAYLEPVVTAAVAVLVLGEVLTPVRLAAMVVVLAVGVVVATDRA